MFRWIEIFFDRMFLSLPVIDRPSIYLVIARRRHHHDKEIAAMLLSICASSLIQPVYEREHEWIALRKGQSEKLLEHASRLRTAFDFGEHVTTNAVVTSFFIFATLLGFGLRSAAWLKLQEAVECGRSLGLHRAASYSGLSAEESTRRFRVLLVLSVTER